MTRKGTCIFFNNAPDWRCKLLDIECPYTQPCITAECIEQEHCGGYYAKITKPADNDSRTDER